ncbi:MAG: dihydropteroate synthase [Pseudomonadota bacterium]
MIEKRPIIREELISSVRQTPMLMGVLNVTPDSFSDGGLYADRTDALARAKVMVEEGAAILDIGGESTRPGSTPVSEADELTRTEQITSDLFETALTPLSIDTYKAKVAAQNAAAGAVIVNDISGMTSDPAMADAVAKTGSIIVVTYNRGETREDINFVDDMRAFFDTAYARAAQAGIPKSHIWLDPGIGFAKTVAQNFQALRRLDVICDYGSPVLVGVSRKSFIGKTLNNQVDERLPGTLAAGLYALQNGANVLRVHDVRAHSDAITIQQTIDQADV